MIKIEVYQHMDHLVVAVDAYLAPEGDPQGKPIWSNLSYTTSPLLEHSETAMLQDAITEGIEQAEQRASERGGWSLLT